MTTAADVPSPIPDLAYMRITPDVDPELRQLAYDRFVYDFVSPDDPRRPPDQPTDSLWAFTPVIYQMAAEGSCYRTVFDAVAYVNYANRCAAPQAMALAEECMAKGINLISKMVADKKMAATDETLCSVYLLGVYENMTTVQRKGTFIAHQHGANALMSLRSIDEFFSHPISGKLYEVTYCQLLLGNLQTAKRPPLPVQDVLKVENNLSSLYKNSNQIVMHLIWREAHVHARWHDIKRNSVLPRSRGDLQELLQTALDLEAAFQAWEAEIPPAWTYYAEPNTPETRSKFELKWQKLILDCVGAPSEIHTYPNLKRCWIWGFFRTTRMFLLRDILEIVTWMLRLPPKVLESTGADVQQSANAFTSSHQEDPACFGDEILRAHYAVTTAHLIRVIDVSCSAILGTMTTSMIAKRDGDLSGMRGYISLWPLGIMDAILASGLLSNANTSWPTQHTHQTPSITTPPQQPPIIISTPPQDTPSLTPEAYAAAPQYAELSKLPPKLPNESSASPPPDASQTPTNFPQPSSTPQDTPRKSHIFNSSPAHPNDQPIGQVQLDASHTIDITARREWLNTLLYYIATEMGIKKALYVPITEGFMQKVKPKVDTILATCH
ncbi:hypothetical protein NX059_009056 [Plenodomus lindquistii]|nr:hypothetical protein NX059_009056 [Plenodomus lindquistii]